MLDNTVFFLLSLVKKLMDNAILTSICKISKCMSLRYNSRDYLLEKKKLTSEEKEAMTNFQRINNERRSRTRKLMNKIVSG